MARWRPTCSISPSRSATGDRFGLGIVVHALGELEDIAGEHDAAARAYDEAIALARELGNDDDLPQFMSRRATLAARRGDVVAERAKRPGQRHRVLHRELGARADREVRRVSRVTE